MGKLIIFFLCSFFFLCPKNTYAQEILNPPTASQYQCVKWLENKNASKDLIDLVPFIFKESTVAKVDPILVIAQTSLETNYFKSSLCKSNYNTAGIKQRGNTSKYAKYLSYEEGLKAQINHLALYAGNPQEDYYYISWLDGWVKDIEGLTGTWAEDKNYSKKILSMMNEIYLIEDEKEVIKPVKEVQGKPKNKIYEILNKKDKEKFNAINIIKNILKGRQL